MGRNKISYSHKPQQDLSTMFTLKIVKKKPKVFIKYGDNNFILLGHAYKLTPPK